MVAALRADIPWRRLVAEGAAIVVSILLAFAIDAWWEERQERVEEHQILHDLADEFTLIRNVLADHKDTHLVRLAALESLLVRLDAGDTVVARPDLAGALEDLFSPTTTDISDGTLHALLSSGRLEIISSGELREKLVGWEGAIEEVWDDQQDHAKRVYEVHVAFFVEQGFGMGEVVDLWYGKNTAPTRTISDDPAELERLLADSRFRSMLEVNYVFKLHLTDEFGEAIAAADAILAEIAASITATTN